MKVAIIIGSFWIISSVATILQFAFGAKSLESCVISSILFLTFLLYLAVELVRREEQKEKEELRDAAEGRR